MPRDDGMAKDAAKGAASVAAVNALLGDKAGKIVGSLNVAGNVLHGDISEAVASGLATSAVNKGMKDEPKH